MKMLKNLNTIVTTISAILSIIMFFLAKAQKDKCIEIKNKIDQSIKILNKSSKITSSDKYHIKEVGNFNNNKFIK